MGANMEWQPIETAPKDGTWILVYCDDPDDMYEALDDSFENRPVSAQWTTNLNGLTVEGHWQFAWFDGGYYGDCKPTHWMPLPEPPSA